MSTTTSHLDELLVGAEPMALELFGRAGPTEVRRIRHWLAKGIIRSRKLGALHTITRQELRAQVVQQPASEAA
jgi:hypothetical protein